jgi:hypothetical protein
MGGCGPTASRSLAACVWCRGNVDREDDARAMFQRMVAALPTELSDRAQMKVHGWLVT